MKQTEVILLAEGIWQVLSKRKQQHLAPQVMALLGQKFAAWQERIVVESAYGLSSAEQKKLMTLLKKNYGVSEATFVVTPTLIGGMKIHFGDKILDLSMQQKLEQLASNF